MKLPHLEPLVFAKDVISRSEDSTKVECVFEEIPKLTTFIEAVAQSSSSFVEPTKPMLGFLVKIKDIKQHTRFSSLAYIVSLHLQTQIGEYLQFSFEVFAKNSDIVVVSGSFTVVIKEV
ncbi:MAG: hypothetical protein ACOCP1_02480 [Campylobacterales bacterium]